MNKRYISTSEADPGIALGDGVGEGGRGLYQRGGRG